MKRQPSRDCVNQERSSKNARRPVRLVLEPLENRRLLAGLNVSVFIDQDGSRSLGAADAVAARRILYVDLNGNSQQDASDPIAFTNDRGVASFADLEPGEYDVGIVSLNQSQTQTFPVRVEELATNVAPSASTLIANSDLSKVWTFDATGRGQLVSGANSNSVAPINLNGSVVASVVVGNEAWLTTAGQSSDAVAFHRLDLSTGSIATSSISGLNGRAVDRLVLAGSRVIAQLSTPQSNAQPGAALGIELAGLTLVNDIPTLGRMLPLPGLTAVAGSPSGELAVVQSQSSMQRTASSSLSTLSILSASDFAIRSSTSLPLDAAEVAFGADGRTVFAAFASGGVIALQNNSTLPVVARLAEAASPLLTNSKDGRLVTGNSNDTSEFIVWDMATWQPSGRSRISVSSDSRASAANAVKTAVLASTGDRLVSTGAAGTFVAQLAEPTVLRAVVPNEGMGSVQLGVRADRTNLPPSTAPITVNATEDTAISGMLRSQTTDANGDTLWFSLLSGPSSGRLDLAADGQWRYLPSSNFNGVDRAVVRVFDGQTSSDVALVVNVAAVNDPPQDLQVQLLSPVTENADGSQLGDLGYVTVFDADRGSQYKFETSDPRFQITNGRITLAPGARLNYEEEQQIELEIFAIEDAVSGYQISTTATLTVADVNEAPTSVRILDSVVPENSAGAVIGQIVVDDPDGSSDFEFVVSDPRFFVSGGYLMLKPGVELDYEEASSINLSIRALDGTGTASSDFPVSFTIANVNDPPTDIAVRLTTIEENSPGAVFGEIAVIDEDGDAYQFTVSDPRFEVVDGQIKLKDDQMLDSNADNSLSLTVTATSLSGHDTISNAFTIAVGSGPSPFQNPVEPRDVNGDGQITPVDALIVINRLNSFGPGPLGGAGRGSGEGPMWVDVNGDGVISPLDVLIIINWLNRRRLVAVSEVAAEGEGQSTSTPPVSGLSSPLPTPMPQPPLAPQLVTFPIDVDSESELEVASMSFATPLACPAVEFADSSKTNAQDDELELLLEQISRQRLSLG